METIEHIDQVTPHLTEGIKVKERSGYTVIDYSFAAPGTFSNPMALECRGLKFDVDGNLIARPFQKFFNVGEKQSAEEIDWAHPHRIYQKLDGSMVHGCLLDGKPVMMTRGGISPQAQMAMDRSSDKVWALVKETVNLGMTPIFEFTSPENRIVVSYDDDRMTLLAIRNNLTGEYVDHESIAKVHGVDCAAVFGAVSDPELFISKARALVGEEGYVIAFSDGHRLKIKGEDYVFRHTALATIGSEKRVLRMVLDCEDDDVLPLLPPAIAARLIAYKADVSDAISDGAQRVSEFVEKNEGIERKEFAARAKSSLDGPLLPAAFAVLDGRDPAKTIRDFARRASATQSRREELEAFLPVSWSLDDLPLHEIKIA